jgi:hypothetical protein
MKFYCKWPAMLGGLLLTSAIDAGALDDIGGIPASTVRTEILRGARDAAACALKAEHNNVVLADCAYKVHLRNLAEDTGTMAFTLGLFFEGWVRAAASPAVKNRWSAERVARDFFYISNHHARELGLAPEVVCQLTDNNCDRVMPMWNKWKERVQQPMHFR